MRKLPVSLVMTILLLMAVNLHAAPSRSENRAWDAAVTRFQEAASPSVWILSEAQFAEFTRRFPSSERYGEAVVYRARALYSLGKYDAAIALLHTESGKAGFQTDQYRYWIAMSYLKKGDDEKAADNFARLARENADSPLRPEAFFRQAEAHSRLGEWKRVIEDLGEKGGSFQSFAVANPRDDRATRGWLLLAQAQLMVKNLDEVEKVLSGEVAEAWTGDFAWQRQMLLCSEKLARGDAEKALAGSTNLLALAGEKPELKARSILMQGQALEILGRLPEAVKAYQSNLDPELSLERRREAFLRMVELMLRQGRVADAYKLKVDFLASNPDANGGDVETLVSGEVDLKLYYQGKNSGAIVTNDTTSATATTNLLQSASDSFLRIINSFTNSPHKGKAELYLGWCDLERDDLAGAQNYFSSALHDLPPSEERAMAQFKLGDIALKSGQFEQALTEYRAVLAQTNDLAIGAAIKELRGRVWYQMIRTGLESSNLVVATDAMKSLLAENVDGQLAERSLLLVSQAQSPKESRALLADLIARYPQSEVLPQARLALARSYELEGDWTNAMESFHSWIVDFPTNSARAQAEFSLAWMTYKSGNETNAYGLFTNYVATYQNNPVARSNDYQAMAQNWVGDYFWRQEEFQKAEISYEEVFKNWPDSPMAYHSLMMAGRAAIQRQSPQDARSYFTNLTSNPNCPVDIKVQALYALGDANLSLATPTNLSSYEDALEDFNHIVHIYSNNPMVPLAFGRMGECCYAFAPIYAGTNTNTLERIEQEMLTYGNASNYFSKAIELGDPYVRGKAEAGLARTLVAMAKLVQTPEQRTNYDRSALEHYLNVFDGTNLTEEQSPDLYWVQEAGQKAAELSEELGEPLQAKLIYQRLIKTLPSLKPALEKKIAKIELNLQATPRQP